MPVPVMDIRPMRMGMDVRFVPVVVMVGLLWSNVFVRMVMVPISVVMLVLVHLRLMGVAMGVLIPKEDNE